MPKEPIVSFKYINKGEEPGDNVVGTLYFMDASAIYIGVNEKEPHCIFKGSSYMPYDSSAFLWRQGVGTNSVTQVLGTAKALGENSIIAANDTTGKTYTNTYTITDNNPSTGAYDITPDPTDDLEIGDIVKITIRGGGTYFAKIRNVQRFLVFEGTPIYRIYLDGFTSSANGAALTKAADIAYGACSGFFGNGNTVAGTTSYVLGLDLTARNNGEFAVGVLNKSNAMFTGHPGRTTRFSVGIGDYIENNGDSSVPRNALEIMQNGDTYINGIGNYDGSNFINASTLQEVVGNSKVFYGVCDTSADTTDKAVACKGFTADDLKEGVMVSVKFDYTNSAAVDTITLAVNDTSAYPIKKIYGTTSSNAGIKNLYQVGELAADAVIPFVFTGQYWLVAGVDMNVNTTYTMNYSVDSGQYKAGNGTYAVTRHSLLMEKPDETWEKITSTAATYTTATTKTVNTSGFLLNRIRYYGTTAIKADGALIVTNTCYSKAASVDMRYSTNCGASPGWAVGDYIYLVGTLGSDGLFYLDTTTWWSNALPSTNDGKLYIRLGLVLANSNGNPTYNISFFDDRLIFYHDGTTLRQYIVADNKQDVISDLDTIRANASAGAAKVSNVQADWNASTGLAAILNKPTIPAEVTETTVTNWGFTKNTGTITGITMNGNSMGTSGVVDLGTVLTTAPDISGKADSSAAIGSLSLSINSTNYQITLSGTKVDGTPFTVSNVIDLPLESVVVDGSYNNSTKKVVLTLQNGSSIDFSVADLVSGLQSEITTSNKLSADLISDGNTNKTVTATEKSTWNGKQDSISDLATIRANASEGAAKVSNVQADWDATTGLAQILNRPDWLLEKEEVILNVNPDMAAYNPYNYDYIHNKIEGGYRFARPNTAQNAITFGISDLYISESEIPATEELYIPIDNTTFLADDSSMHVFMDIVLNSGISLPASILTDDRDLADIYGYIRLDFIYEHDQYNPVYAFRSKNLSTLYDDVSRYVTNCTVSFTKLSEQYENNIWRISEDSYINEYNVALPIKQEYRKSFYDCSILSIGNITIDLETDLSFRLIDGVTICINSDSEIGAGRTIRLNVNDTGSRAIVNGKNSLMSYINSGTSILTYSETSNKWVYVSDTPEVGSGFLYIRKNGQNIIGKSYYDSTVAMSFNANIEDDVVYDISVNELPDVSTADNGKIMMVVNGQWSMVEPVAIYSGDGDPSNNLGKNGDLYLQTGK